MSIVLKARIDVPIFPFTGQLLRYTVEAQVNASCNNYSSDPGRESSGCLCPHITFTPEFDKLWQPIDGYTMSNFWA